VRKVTREITIETTETILSQHGSTITASYCPQCGADSRLVPFAEIVSTFGMDALMLHRWVNERRVHFQLSEKGGLLICWNTLSALLQQHPEAASESRFPSSEGAVPAEKRIVRAAGKQTKGHTPRRSS